MDKLTCPDRGEEREAEASMRGMRSAPAIVTVQNAAYFPLIIKRPPQISLKFNYLHKA